MKEDNAKRYKSLFLTYFDGVYGIEPTPNTSNTYAMGVCKLEYMDTKHGLNKEPKLIVHLRRPGLLIGKGGSTINALKEYLGIDIGIVEVSLYK